MALTINCNNNDTVKLTTAPIIVSTTVFNISSLLKFAKKANRVPHKYRNASVELKKHLYLKNTFNFETNQVFLDLKNTAFNSSGFG